LKNKFNGYNFSVHVQLRRSQFEAIAFNLDGANLVGTHPVLYEGYLNVMDHFVTLERESSRVRDKCPEGLCLRLRRRRIGGSWRKKLSSAVADHC